MRRSKLWLVCLSLSISGCGELPIQQMPAATSQAPALPESPAMEYKEPVKTDAQISTTLIDLLENKEKLAPNVASFSGTPAGEMLSLGSPIGYSLRNRYLNLGVPIAEALSRNSDPVFREKLVTSARWDKDEVRAAALVALAQAQDPAHVNIFREALVHLTPAVRFGALEALLTWNHPGIAIPLLAAAAEKDNEPILRVYAAAGLARLGDSRGLPKLRQFLDDASWLVRAMAGRYIGDYGTPDDYTLMVQRIGREQNNDFVLAEYCIAALKLFAKKPA